MPGGLRTARHCVFTGKVVMANGMCWRWLPAGAFASAWKYAAALTFRRASSCKSA